MLINEIGSGAGVRVVVWQAGAIAGTAGCSAGPAETQNLLYKHLVR